MRLLWLLDHALQRTSKRMNRELGVTGPQRLAIRVIGRAPDISPGELASTLHVDPSTLTGILERLERRKLIVRLPDASDGRRTRLRLSAAGRGQDRQRAGTVEAAVRAALAESTPDEHAAAARVLVRIADALDRPGRQAAPPRARSGA
jgi:DNA-binding MarR family transcriptional regulator